MTKTLSQSDVKVLREALEPLAEFADLVDRNPHYDYKDSLAFWAYAGKERFRNIGSTGIGYKACDNARKALAILDAQEAAQPEGEWVTVPREPTEAMINAGAGVQYGHFVRETTIPIGCDTAKAAYKAMLLAAAPQPGAMKGIEELAQKIIDYMGEYLEGNPLLIQENAVRYAVPLALAPQQPAPSGDARELAEQLERECNTYEGLRLEETATLLTAFATATRSRALEDAAKYCEMMKINGIHNSDLNFAAIGIRALAKRGG